MLSHFPSFYPDEILYSAIARLARRCRLQSDAGAMDKTLYGSRNKHLGFGFPAGINHLLALIPPDHGLTADLIIDNHTFLPFYEPFLPLENAEELRAGMRNQGQTALPTRGLGISKNFDDTRYLRFCPSCRDADRIRFKETYWRRLHQIALVKVCPEHQVFLQDSILDRRSMMMRRDYVCADAVCLSQQIVPIDLDNKSHSFCVWMAEQVKWLLNYNNTDVGLKELKQCYRDLLRKRGLATFSGKIDVHKLRDQFCSFYGHKLLEEMNSSLSTNTKEFWLKQWTRNFHRYQSPQRHLMLIKLMGMSVERCFALIEQREDEEKGPWLCLNPFSPCRNKPTIHSYRLQQRQPKAIFRCPECEYEYSRRFPLSSQDQVTPAYIRNRGLVWVQHLLGLWMNPALNSEEISRQMGVTQPTIIKYAMREGFPIPRPGRSDWQPTSAMEKVASVRFAKDVVAIRETHRVTWLAHLAQHPQETRSRLRQGCANTSYWLSRNDRQWLNEHLPPRKARPTSYADWSQRDASLAALIDDVCVKLIEEAKDAASAPIRITVTNVQKVLEEQNGFTRLTNNLKRLPSTAAKLLKYTEEDHESLMHRKIDWAVRRCRSLALRLTFSEFVLLARLELIRLRVRLADEIIKKAMEDLQNYC